ncbi:MAG: ATP-binding protein [Proteobacteria bacterium]|nr:ATP-binding protein [Pseudomonadota bacterium]
MSDTRTVALTIPGLLEFRDLAMRVVMESCNLVGTNGLSQPADGNGESQPALSDTYDFSDDFTLAFSSGFSEIFNNIVLHAYDGGGGGTIRCEIRIATDHLAVEITDTGRSFDLTAVKPLEEALPMGGMGITIARGFLDEVDYESGPPNRWRLVKYLRRPSEPQGGPSVPPEASGQTQ